MGRAYLSGGALVSTKTPFPVVPDYSSSWFPSMPPMAGHWWNAYAGIYERHLWVAVVVGKRARATARLPLLVYRKTEDDSRERQPAHPMFALLERPNPGMSGFNLWLWTSSIFDIYGDAFWLKRRQGGRVVGLYPLHPAAMTERDGLWTFDNGATVVKDIPDSDLVHFKGFHPTLMTRGMSPLEPLRATLENEWHARTATSSFWQRGARPGLAIKHPANISQAAQDRLRAQFDNTYGGSDNTGRTLLLEEGMEPSNLSLTAEEAQYIETRKLNREEVCAAYDVPPPVVHILDRATFSNITEQMRSMYRDTMAPHLKAFEATLEVDLRQAEFGRDDVYAEFLMDEVLRGDFETRQDALNKADHMTIAEKRRVENLPFIEGTDRIFLNSATLPLDAIDAQFGPGGVQTPPAIPVPSPVVRTVVGRLGWQRSLADVDVVKVTAGVPELRSAVERALDEEKRASGSVAGLRARLQGKQMGLTPDQEKVAGILRAFFTRQPDLSPDAWDSTLTRDLHKVSVEVSKAVGRKATEGLGFDPDSYDVDRTLAFLLAVSERLSVSINDTTRRQLADGDRAEVFAKAAESRAPGIAVGVAAAVTGFATVEAGRQAAASHGVKPRKTWHTGHNARSSHAAINGETVGIDEDFSNGMAWPGLGDEDDIGCNCSITVEV